jgi:hypothetical protein
LRSGGVSATFNCGYGRGASVFEVIGAVRRASGRDFPVEVSHRRPGDAPALVANVDRIRATLPWRPRFQNLDPIVAHALAWESSWQAGEKHRSLMTRKPSAFRCFRPLSFGLKIPLSAGKECPLLPRRALFTAHRADERSQPAISRRRALQHHCPIRRLLTEQGLLHWRKYAGAFVLWRWPPAAPPSAPI